MLSFAVENLSALFAKGVKIKKIVTQNLYAYRNTLTLNNKSK